MIEINQVRVVAGGVTSSDGADFPVTLDAPGSYILTGDLAVGGRDTSAIHVTTDDVTLDLRGGAPSPAPEPAPASTADRRRSGTESGAISAAGSTSGYRENVLVGSGLPSGLVSGGTNLGSNLCNGVTCP